MDKKVGKYKIGPLLGTGAFASVYAAQIRTGVMSTETVAIKVFNKSFLRKKRQWKKAKGKMVMQTALNDVEHEIALMKKLKHDRIVRLHEIIDDEDKDRLYLVMDIVSGGELMSWDPSKEQFTTATGLQAFPESVCRAHFRDLVEAVAFLHAHHIIHRDIKPQNLLLGDDGRVKLADFGVAHVFDELPTREARKAGAIRDTKGTIAFMAPECFTGEHYSGYKAEVWAMGVTLFALATGRMPFLADQEGDIMDAIETAELEFPEHVSASLRDLISRMLCRDAPQRISMDQMAYHMWLLEDGDPPVPRPTKEMMQSVSEEEVTTALQSMTNVYVNMRLIQLSNRARLRIAARQARGGGFSVPTPGAGEGGDVPKSDNTTPPTLSDPTPSAPNASVPPKRASATSPRTSKIEPMADGTDDEGESGPKRRTRTPAPTACCVMQ